MIVKKVKRHYVVYKDTSKLYVLNRISLGYLLKHVFRMKSSQVEKIINLVEECSYVDTSKEVAS